MTDFSHPYIVIHHLLRNYHDACNAQDFTKGYEIAVDIAELADQLVEIAQKNANA